MWISALILLPFLIVFGLAAVYAERKVAGFVQDRLGPSEVGKYGLLQTIADILKLIQKEIIIPKGVDAFLFRLAPIIVFTSVFAGFAILPLSPMLMGAGLTTGIFYALAIISLDIVGLLMAGWASNNKYSILGALRAVAQIISYEIPIGLVVLSVVIISQSLDLQTINYQQGIHIASLIGGESEKNFLFGIAATGIETTQIGGFLTWNVFRMPFLWVGFIIFFIATLAESNRAPFDIPEAESELIGGFHTEYSGMLFAIFMLAEYGMMLLSAFLAAILFFGGWNTPLPNIGNISLATWTSGAPNTIYGEITGFFWLLCKVFLIIFLQMWVRWTYPRLRADHLFYLCWKVLVPFSLVLILLSSVWKLWSF
ncbi:MAG: NADH-quinone oxidoreductase subunit H [Cytophagales bacterium]|nr:MAG: NADH-quinone oxidoreductase subunit H [Cytophagales bacterium]